MNQQLNEIVAEDLEQTVLRTRAKAMSDSQRALLDRHTARQAITTGDEEAGTELEPVVIEGELVEEGELAPIETVTLLPIDPDDPAVDTAEFDRKVLRTLNAMPVVGKHGHLRVADDKTEKSLTRAVETLEEALEENL